MKRYLGICFLLCSACTERPEIARSDIEFVAMAYVPGNGTIEVRFASEADLMNILKSDSKTIQDGNTLTCYLDARLDFHERHGQSNFLIGAVDELDRQGALGKHQYSARLASVHSDHEDGSNTFLSQEQLLAFLRERNALACRFSASGYFSESYQSHPVGIASSEFARVMEQRVKH